MSASEVMPDVNHAAQQPAPKKSSPSANTAQKVLAFAAIVAITYFGKLVLITLLFAILLSLILEPLVGFLEHRRMPRPFGAGIAMLLLLGVLYAMSYFFYVKVESFIGELPKYSGQIKSQVIKFREKAEKLNQTRQQITGKKQEQNQVTVKDSMNWFGIAASTGTITEVVLAITLIPFLSYFMLTWQAHMRSGAV